MGLLMLYVTSLFLLILSVQVIRPLVTLWRTRWALTVMNGLVSILRMVKMVSTMRKKLRLSLPKPKKLFKVKVFNSQFTWTFQLIKVLNLMLLKLNHWNKRLKNHWVVKMSLSISTSCHLMICKMQPLMRLMRQQKTGIFQTVWFGVQTIKIHQLTLISLRQLQAKIPRLSWVMMIQTMRPQLK